VLNERQAGVAIEEVVRQEWIETSQLAVDTHTDFAMALARLPGFDLCPRLKDLKQRQLYVPRGMVFRQRSLPRVWPTSTRRLSSCTGTRWCT
jgi:TnpA family transposase